MPKSRKAEPAHTNIKLRKSSRTLLRSLKQFFKVDSMSDAIDLAHVRIVGSTAPLAGKDRE